MSLLARNRDYRLFFSAAAVTNLGDGISVFAFPWLASLLTRDPILISLVAAATRAPWLIFSLPAGVFTDRGDRRKLMMAMDILRVFLTLAVVGLVFSESRDGAIYLLAALAFLLGSAEVLRDNAAQTILPSIVKPDDLERANGTLWSVEQIMGHFIGPPLAGVLIALALPLPFLLDAATFAVATLCVFAMNVPRQAAAEKSGGFWSQLLEGITWIRAHPLILRLAFMLGFMNYFHIIALTALILFAQDVLKLGPASYGFLLTAGAAGGVFGGLTGPKLIARFGPQASVFTSLLITPCAYLLIAFSTHPATVAAALFLEMSAAVFWNIVTVSLRQRVIPNGLLGRVNSIYRFLGWGMMPLGALSAGVIIAGLEPHIGQIPALRAPYLVAALGMGFVGIYGVFRLPRMQ